MSPQTFWCTVKSQKSLACFSFLTFAYTAWTIRQDGQFHPESSIFMHLFDHILARYYKRKNLKLWLYLDSSVWKYWLHESHSLYQQLQCFYTSYDQLSHKTWLMPGVLDLLCVTSIAELVSYTWLFPVKRTEQKKKNILSGWVSNKPSVLSHGWSYSSRGGDLANSTHWNRLVRRLREMM